MTPFAKIYAVTAQIPKGKVSTYNDVARISGIHSARIVGFALHSNKNPKKIPCHRVIKSVGTLAQGYAFGGMYKQKEKLQKEGVKFLDEYHVDLESSLFQPEEKTLQRLKTLFLTK